MIVAIHQPNYAPWLGYFAKMARADVFVFLDDAQYSKNSYINRVQIDAGSMARWLTVPVSCRFGDPIALVQAADQDWRRSHLERLAVYYGGAPAFAEVSPWLAEIFALLPESDLATTNQALIEALAGKLDLRCRFARSSAIATGSAAGDDRLIAILQAIGSNVSYLSGKGGANYQDPKKFTQAGIALLYSEFVHPSYDQGHEAFLPGLSVLDSLFCLGFERTAALLAPLPAAA